MAEIPAKTDKPEDVEDLVYETRFLLNVLIELLIQKKLISEDEIHKKYEQVLNDAERG